MFRAVNAVATNSRLAGNDGSVERDRQSHEIECDDVLHEDHQNEEELDRDLDGCKHVEIGPGVDSPYFMGPTPWFGTFAQLKNPEDVAVEAGFRAFLEEAIPRNMFLDPYGDVVPVADLTQFQLAQMQGKLWRELPRNTAKLLEVALDNITDDDPLVAHAVERIAEKLAQSPHVLVLRETGLLCCDNPLCRRHKNRGRSQNPERFVIALEPLMSFGFVTPLFDPEYLRIGLFVFRRNEKRYDEKQINISQYLSDSGMVFCVSCLRFLWALRVRAWVIMDMICGEKPSNAAAKPCCNLERIPPTVGSDVGDKLIAEERAGMAPWVDGQPSETANEDAIHFPTVLDCWPSASESYSKTVNPSKNGVFRAKHSHCDPENGSRNSPSDDLGRRNLPVQFDLPIRLSPNKPGTSSFLCRPYSSHTARPAKYRNAAGMLFERESNSGFHFRVDLLEARKNSKYIAHLDISSLKADHSQEGAGNRREPLSGKRGCTSTSASVWKAQSARKSHHKSPETASPSSGHASIANSHNQCQQTSTEGRVHSLPADPPGSITCLGLGPNFGWTALNNSFTGCKTSSEAGSNDAAHEKHPFIVPDVKVSYLDEGQAQPPKVVEGGSTSTPLSDSWQSAASLHPGAPADTSSRRPRVGVRPLLLSRAERVVTGRISKSPKARYTRQHFELHSPVRSLSVPNSPSQVPAHLQPFSADIVPSAAAYCFCLRPNDGSKMVKCDNADCAIGWFHSRCLTKVEKMNNTRYKRFTCYICKNDTRLEKQPVQHDFTFELCKHVIEAVFAPGPPGGVRDPYGLASLPVLAPPDTPRPPSQPRYQVIDQKYEEMEWNAHEEWESYNEESGTDGKEDSHP